MRSCLLTSLLILAFSLNGSAQGPGFGGGAGGSERPVVAQYDRDGDGRLNAEERSAARAAMATQGGGRGFRRFGGGRVDAAPGPRLTPDEVTNHPDAPFYDTGVLRTLFLEFENPDWEQELEAFYNTDVEVPATVRVDGTVYRDVGVGFRGQSSYMMVPAGAKRSLNLSFDFVHDGQNVGSYRTLNLLNLNGDPTFVRPVLYAAIAGKYIPAPATNYVRVVINGESWGVYVSAQQYNKDFLRDYFKTGDGARWKVPGRPNGRAGMEYLGDDPAAYRRLYEIRSKDTTQSWNDLIALFRVLNQTPPDRLEAALEPLLDIDGVLRFLALDVALVNSDGYWTRASDYSIYQDPQGRFHIIPHDMNEGLAEGGGRGFGGRASSTLDPLVGLDDPGKPLRSKLLAVPALRARYLGYVRDIAERWLDWSVIGPIVEDYQSLIAADVEKDTKKLYSTEQFSSGIDSLRMFVERRRAFLLEATK
ncbi:MAG: CotH kinase family protein [Vicinamibacterales bacterium]